MTRRTFETTPLIDEVVERVQTHHTHWNKGQGMTTGQALDWILRDIGWCGEDMPAFGRMSPVGGSILEDAFRAVGGEFGTASYPGQAEA